MDSLDTIVFFTEIFRLGLVIVGYILSVKFFMKYVSFKKEEFLWVGLSWLSFTTGYIPGVVVFLSLMVFGYSGEFLILFLICNVYLSPLVALCWFYAVACINYPRYKNKVKWISIAICIFFEILALYIYFYFPNLIGTMQSQFEFQYGLPIMIFISILFIITLITGIHLSITGIKSNDHDIKLKGKFLFVAFIMLFFGGISDAMLETIYPIFGIIAKLFLILSVFTYYYGFFLPKWVKK
ncbi:MAG: hypothetical protein ACFFDK_14005 [Promethearchaeota archaeon]